MRQNVIIWDLETIPDPDRSEQRRENATSDAGKSKEAQEEGFRKPLFHQIVCIGTLVALLDRDTWSVRSIGAPHIGEVSEPELIQGFVDKVTALKPKLVTFNGWSFDLPVLRYRAMIHHISAASLFARGYFNRFSEDAIDLCDLLAAFNSRNKISLQEMSRAYGLGGKPSGIDGAQVEKLVQAKKYDELSDYCQSDVCTCYSSCSSSCIWPYFSCSLSCKSGRAWFMRSSPAPVRRSNFSPEPEV